MEFIRNLVDARYKDTQADIMNIKEHLLKLTGSTSTSIFEKDDDDDNDAKKGEKDSLRKLPPDSKANPTEIVSPAQPKSQSSPKKPPQKKEKIPSTPSSPILSIDVGNTKVSADVYQTAAETPVVSAEVSQTSAMIIFTTPTTIQPLPTSQRFPTHPSSPPKYIVHV